MVPCLASQCLAENRRTYSTALTPPGISPASHSAHSRRSRFHASRTSPETPSTRHLSVPEDCLLKDLEIIDYLLNFTAVQLGVDAGLIDVYRRRQPTISEHQHRIASCNPGRLSARFPLMPSSA